MARRFPVRLLGAADAANAQEAGGGATAAAPPGLLGVGPSGARWERDEDGRLLIRGADRGGAAWSVRPGDFAHRSRFYAGDLDRDGTQDLILVFPTGGNGLAPTSHLFAVTFDARGRPVPFEADGYFEEDGRGLFDLVDLDGDGRAELVYMNFDRGYWVTNLYEAEGGRWRRVEGRHGARAYPLYTRFTSRPNRRPVNPRPGRRPFAPDLSTRAPVLSGALVSYEWADVGQSKDVRLTIAAGGARSVCSPVSWYASFGVVDDAPQGREVVTAFGNEGRVKELLTRAAEGGAAVSLYGRRRDGRCSPEWVWLAGGAAAPAPDAPRP
ncbi:MAG TPA: hypothetical protein VF668_05490 [Pyrinomonadaceae bacterium]|jgi:hypothetical protein